MADEAVEAAPAPYYKARPRRAWNLSLPGPHPYNPRLETEVPARKLECANYDRCLDVALEQHWLSWRCGRCPKYCRAGDEQLASDVIGLLRLVMEVKHPSKKRRGPK